MLFRKKSVDKRGVSLGLIDKVGSELPACSYTARECFDSGRAQLHYRGRIFCMLSSPETDIYCPAQTEKEQGSILAECRRDSYFAELIARRKH